MPIKPENLKRYPADWKAIRARILERARNRCEECGVKNHTWRKKDGECTDNPMIAETWELVDRERVTYIVLTIAHRDHTPENCDDENLRAWCQRCHLRYDHAQHQVNAAATRRANKRTLELAF